MENTQKFDIFAVSVPDYKAQEAVARIISAQNYVPMQTAMEKAKATPVLLFHDIELGDAGHHIAELKALGVGFRVERLEEPEAEADGSPKPDDSERASIEPPDPKADADPLAIEGAAMAQPVLSDILTAADTTEPAAKPARVPNVKREEETRHLPPAEDDLRYHKHSEGGVRIEGVGLDAIRKSEEETRKKSIMISVVIFSVLIVIGSIVAFLPKKYTFSANSSSNAPTKPGGKETGTKQADKHSKRDMRVMVSSASSPSKAASAAQGSRQQQPSNEQLRAQVGGAQKQQSNAYADSARSPNIGHHGSAAFYKVAISFNRYNLQAWHGLLQAYRGMGDLEEARKTEAQMREIFGESVNSVSTAVSRFGELEDAYMSDGETYRVAYRSKKSSRDDVLREVFDMTRALRNACRCQSVSIHAYTAEGKEMIAHSTEKAPTHSLTEFSKKAEIFWLE